MDIKVFYDDLMPRFPQADEALVLHETYAAIRRFCEEGWAWYVDVGPLNVVEGRAQVQLDPGPVNSRVGYVLSGWLVSEDGRRRRLSPMNYPPQIYSTVNSPGTPAAYYLEEPGSIILAPIPEKDYPNSLLLQVTYIPTSDSCDLPDYFYSHYRDSIIDGVVARMSMIPAKPWTSASMANLAGKKFNNDIAKTRTIVKQRFLTGDITWSFPDFAGMSGTLGRKPATYW